MGHVPTRNHGLIPMRSRSWLTGYLKDSSIEEGVGVAGPYDDGGVGTSGTAGNSNGFTACFDQACVHGHAGYLAANLEARAKEAKRMGDHFINLYGSEFVVNCPTHHSEGMACEKKLGTIPLDDRSVLLMHADLVRLLEAEYTSDDNEIAALENSGSLGARSPRV